MDPKDEVINELEATRDALDELMDPERVAKIKAHTARRNVLVLRGLGLGISERRLSKAAGIARSYIWKLKKQ